MYQFAQQPDSEHEQIQSKKKQRQRTHASVKETLKQCKNTIAELVRGNQELHKKLKQKETIILQLIEQKQEYLLHKASCNAEVLMRQLQMANSREQHLNQCLKDMEEKYDKIIQKHQTQIQRLSSYNRALKIDNASLREYKELHAEKKRKIGTISQSCKKEQQINNQFEITRINEDNVEEKLERHFSVTLQTPNKNYNYDQYKGLPTTEPSLKATHSVQLSPEKSNIPRNLFSNKKIREHTPSQFLESKFRANVIVNHRLMSIEQVLRRVNDLLTESEQDC